MRVLRRFLVMLTAGALVAASLTVSMASVMEAAGAMKAAMSADAQSDAAPGCADCGRNAVPANACALHCMIPPADIATAVALVPLPVSLPAAAPVTAFTGRVLAPDLHPPKAAV
jgi:hypothetical protein